MKITQKKVSRNSRKIAFELIFASWRLYEFDEFDCDLRVVCKISLLKNDLKSFKSTITKATKSNETFFKLFQQKMVPQCKPEWNREAVTVFSRLPSLLAADKPCPLLQPYLVNTQFF